MRADDRREVAWIAVSICLARAGVLTFSSGNHAQAVALAASLMATKAVVVMPHDAPEGKLAATKGYGAEVIQYDRYREDREALGKALAEERLHRVAGHAVDEHPDHPDVFGTNVFDRHVAQFAGGRLRLVAALLEGPTAWGFRTDLWTLKRVGQVIAKTCHVSYSVPQVWRVLGQLGWSRQRPDRRARERNERAIRRWREGFHRGRSWEPNATG